MSKTDPGPSTTPRHSHGLLAWMLRLVEAAAGGVGVAVVVAFVEARDLLAFGAGAQAIGGWELAVADLSVLAPLAVVLSLAMGGFVLFLEPGRAVLPFGFLLRSRMGPVEVRSRNAALGMLAVFTVFGWCIAVGHVARTELARGSPVEAGVSLGVASVVGLLILTAIALALLSPLAKLVAAGASLSPPLADPLIAVGAALAVVLAAAAWGIHIGDTGGNGVGPLAILGVLKRAELDLRPVVELGAVALGAVLAPVALARSAGRAWVAAAGTFVGLALVLTVHEASALNDTPATAQAIERGAPLGKIALALVRRATDRDHDGASPWFAGGDCDDHDPRRNPNAVEIAGNGVDEDCSGADLSLVEPEPSATAEPSLPKPSLDPDLNLLLITIDTLRADLGFMGYDKPVSPNLDRLAERGVIFDRMYALASYTGKSIGPLLIGKYPSETQRDGGHFNAYYGTNTFVAKRLRAAKVHTMGAASHWYFVAWSGLIQGMDTWDLSARPSGGQGDNDTSITSAQLSDAALRLLSNPDHTGKRFFMWLHYFDPHEQYMPHPEAPSFLPEKASPLQQARAAYDGEIWFTDRHVGRVLDYVASQPWGEKTAIIVTSDHGETFGEHHMNWHGNELWEPLVHVPFVVYVPGMTPHHVPVKRSHIDLVPTILDLMSIPQPPPGELSGQSMLDDLVNDGRRPFEERDVYVDMPQGPYSPMRHALISGPTPGMKLVQVSGKYFQLFDLAADPDEAEDLAGDRTKLGPMLQRFNAKRAQLKEIEVPPTPPP